ncbi:MAG: HAMP domain-containing histidine kinase [Lachnospiraceae bacterium]|nr:HAMP domain-containing histidine kinase [Lachnospiraceae bacterium]
MKFLRNTLGQKLTLLYLVLFALCFIFTHTEGTNYIENKVIDENVDMLKNAGTIIVTRHIEQQDYTQETIKNFQSHIEIGAETIGCRILLVNMDGDILIDTENPKTRDNIYRYSGLLLRQEYTADLTLKKLVKEPALAVPLPITNSTFLKGYVVLLQPMKRIQERSNYYFNILDGLFYIFMLVTGMVFLVIYFYNIRPLKKLIKESKAFSIRRDNPPIQMRSNDEYRDLADTLNIIGEEMSKFDEYQKMFIANISHDFRSPLTSIQGYAEAILDGTIPHEKQDKYLHTILFQTERLNHLTSNLLALNTFDQNSIFLDYSNFDIHACIYNTVDTLEGVAEQKNIYFTLNFENVPLYVYADINRIQQVLHNLLDNAIKFSHSDSYITITTKKKGKVVFVSVKDTGIGIPKEDQKKVWERFYKSDISRGKDKKGTGLGLCICKEIIDAHKQTINVVSTEGVGSEFMFTLKAVKEES